MSYQWKTPISQTTTKSKSLNSINKLPKPSNWMKSPSTNLSKTKRKSLKPNSNLKKTRKINLFKIKLSYPRLNNWKIRKRKKSNSRRIPNKEKRKWRKLKWLMINKLKTLINIWRNLVQHLIKGVLIWPLWLRMRLKIIRILQSRSLWRLNCRWIRLLCIRISSLFLKLRRMNMLLNN